MGRIRLYPQMACMLFAVLCLLLVIALVIPAPKGLAPAASAMAILLDEQGQQSLAVCVNDAGYFLVENYKYILMNRRKLRLQLDIAHGGKLIVDATIHASIADESGVTSALLLRVPAGTPRTWNAISSFRTRPIQNGESLYHYYISNPSNPSIKNYKLTVNENKNNNLILNDAARIYSGVLVDTNDQVVSFSCSSGWIKEPIPRTFTMRQGIAIVIERKNWEIHLPTIPWNLLQFASIDVTLPQIDYELTREPHEIRGHIFPSPMAVPPTSMQIDVHPAGQSLHSYTVPVDPSGNFAFKGVLWPDNTIQIREDKLYPCPDLPLSIGKFNFSLRDVLKLHKSFAILSNGQTIYGSVQVSPAENHPPSEGILNLKQKQPINIQAAGPVRITCRVPDGSGTWSGEITPVYRSQMTQIPVLTPKIESMELLFGGTGTATCSGGNGRYLAVALSHPPKVVLMDLQKRSIVTEIPCGEQSARIAANQTDLFILDRLKPYIQRFSLSNGWPQNRTADAPISTLRGTFIGAGSASPGPLYTTSWGATGVGIFDATTLMPMQWNSPGGKSTQGIGTRVSADGIAFAPVTNDNFRDVFYTRSARINCVSVPIHATLRPMNGGTVLGFDRGAYLVPDSETFSYIGPFLPHFSMLEAPKSGYLLGLKGNDLTFFSYDGLKPLATLNVPELEGPSPDQRIFYVDSENILAVIPATKDRVVIRSFNLHQALLRSENSFLFVNSIPPRGARANKVYQYSPKICSNSPTEVTLLESPPGMEVDATGTIKWTPPSSLQGQNAGVILQVKNSTLLPIIHSWPVFVE